MKVKMMKTLSWLSSIMLLGSICFLPSGHCQGGFKFEQEFYCVTEDTSTLSVNVVRDGVGVEAPTITLTGTDITSDDVLDYEMPADVMFDSVDQFKTVVVTIVDDADVEETECFVISLSNPTDGNLANFQTATTICIKDNDDEMCSGPCENNGLCVADEVCICPDGFSGQYCDTPDPVCNAGRGCVNDGLCVGYDVCVCPRGFQGEFCETLATWYFFDSTEYFGYENVGSVTIVVQRDGVLYYDATASISITAQTAKPGDYMLASGTAFFIGANKDATASVALTIVNDAKVEGTEYLVVEIDSVSEGSIGEVDKAIVNIIDDDTDTTGTLSMMPNVYTIPESVGSFEVFFQRHGDLSSSLDIDLTVTQETAKTPGDFSFQAPAANTTFMAGQSTAHFTFTIKDDMALEDHEYFRVAIDTNSLPGNIMVEGAGEARVYIWDDDVEFAVCPANVSYASVDYPSCVELTTLSETHVNTSNVAEVSDYLARVTDNIETVSDDDLTLVAGTLENIVSVGDGSMEVTNSVVNVVSNILESSSESSSDEESDVTDIDDNASTAIITSLETQASIALDMNTELLVIESNVALSGVVLDNESTIQGGGIGFGVQTSSEEGFGNNSTRTYRMRDDILNHSPDAYIYVPEVSNENDSNQRKYIFIAYKNDFLFPSNKTITDNLSVGGVIISASIEGSNNTDVIELEEPVVFESGLNPDITTDRNVSSNQRDSCNQDPEVTDPRCVFWDFKLTANGNGDWSQDGCRYMGENEGRVVCHCDHLTNFAVLVYHGKTPVLSKALDIFSTVGCAVSVASLVVTIAVFLIFKTLRKKSRIILIQLCISLIILYASFLVGIDRTCPRLPCTIIAIVLHYAVLSSVSWMVVEARYLYVKLVNVFDSESRNFVVKYSIVAWGLPLLIVGASVGLSTGLDLGYYQNPHYCFVAPGPILYYALLLPIGLALLFNIVTFFPIIRSITRQRPGQASNRRGADKQELVTRVRNVIAISSVLGLTWVFGFFAIDKAAFAFQILFCVFNSVQGVLIFVLFCLMQPDVQEVLRGKCTKKHSRRKRNQKQWSGPASSASSPAVQSQTDSTSALTSPVTLTSSEANPNEGFELSEHQYAAIDD